MDFRCIDGYIVGAALFQAEALFLTHTMFRTQPREVGTLLLPSAANVARLLHRQAVHIVEVDRPSLFYKQMRLRLSQKVRNWL